MIQITYPTPSSYITYVITRFGILSSRLIFMAFSVISEKNSLCFCVLKSCPLSPRHTHASLKHILVLLFLSFYYVPTVFGILYPSQMLVHYRENTFFPKMKKMLRNEFKGLIESQIQYNILVCFILLQNKQYKILDCFPDPHLLIRTVSINVHCSNI